MKAGQDLVPIKRLPANPDVLRWARVHQAIGLHDAADRLGIEIEELGAIEDGHELVSVKLFDRMVSVYGISESVLLLPKPPPLRPAPDDFRTALGAPPLLLPDTRAAIREAWEFVEDATELLFEESAARDAVAALPAATLDDDAALIATQERERLGVSFETQTSWKGKEAFDGWRAAFDRAGIIVLLKAMPWDDCRGFLLWAPDLMPAVVVNSIDSDNARIFTLFHEYAHLLLRQPSACVQTERETLDSFRRISEGWCNAFAANLLMPKDEVEELVSQKLKKKPLDEWGMGDYQYLSGRFRVSSMAIARRLKELYDDDFYDTHFLELRGRDRQKKESDKPGGPAPNVVKFSEVGPSMAGRIVLAMKSSLLSRREAADMLGLSAGQLSAFQVRLPV